jgi:hypothetical protein
MNQLIPWDTPFIKSKYPSVGVYFEHGEDETDLVSAVVAPDGIDEYPKYLVEFGEVFEVKYYEEGCSPDRGYENLLHAVKGSSSCEWLCSPSIECYQDLAGEKILRHFLLFGADNILEIVTVNNPKASLVAKPRKIEIEINV